MSDDEQEEYEEEAEDDEEDYYEDVEVIPGAGQAEVDDETADFDARVERLAAWEEQLLAYNGKLAEEGWKSWKKGAVTSVMHELQRKVVPDVWRDEVGAANERVRSMSEQLKEVRERERILTERIDLLENGPGCARELAEQLEVAEVQLNQEQARQRQRRVMAEMLTVNNDAAAGKRGSTDGKTDGKTGGVASAVAAMVAFEKKRAAESGESDHLGVRGAAPELQQRVAAAERRFSEAQEELLEAKAERDTKVSELQLALEEERKRGTRATQALRAVHVEAGIHEAQEMVQLKLELAALTEETEFLRERETEVDTHTLTLTLAPNP